MNTESHDEASQHRPPSTGLLPAEVHSCDRALSWGAIVAGAAGGAALSLILLILGTGLGLSSVSAWSLEGVSAPTFGVTTILWLTLTQIAASGMGGYLAGRLRTKWVGVPRNEAHFRDTAHGFLAWAVSSLGTAALLTAVIGSIVGGGIKAGATAATTAATLATAVAAKSDSINYFVDFLFRKDMSVSSTAPASDNSSVNSAMTEQTRAVALSESTRIFINSLRMGELPPQDVRYVGQVVATFTGLSQQDAEKRVTETFASLQTKLKDTETAARDAADKARKASAYVALWLFISLLSGAFVASLAATIGGRQRDA